MRPQDRGPSNATLVSKRVPYLPLLLTCHQISSEVHSLLKPRVRSSTLHLLIDGANTQSPLMQTILRYMAPPACSINCDIPMQQYIDINMLASELDTPERMAKVLLLHKMVLEGSTVTIEIAMQFWDDSGVPAWAAPSGAMPRLGFFLLMIYCWVAGVSEARELGCVWTLGFGRCL